MANFDKVDFVTGMRRMFYIVSPNETSFKTADEVPKYINEVCLQIVPYPDIFVLSILRAAST